MRGVVTIISVLALGIVLHDAFEVMLLPRRVRRRLRLVRLFFRATWAGWAAVARLLRRRVRRETFLGLYGPLSLVWLLIFWATGLILGFGGLQWALHLDTSYHLRPSTAVYLSGTTFFTLGYGDVSPHTPLARALAVVESGMGLGFIAIVIGYLPVLYQLFARREAEVIKLDARAGSPPTATVLLVRHVEGLSTGALDQLLRAWEQWAATLVESHLSYPMLSYYRSQAENQSWLAALTAVMDACALVMVGFVDVLTLQARLTFATGRLATIELCRVFELQPQRSAHDRLPLDAFREMRETLARAGLTFSDETSTESTLAAFRATYEPFAQALATHLLMELPPWIAPEEALDNWQRTRRGRVVKELVESVPAKPA